MPEGWRDFEQPLADLVTRMEELAAIGAKDEVKRQRESMDCLKNFRARVTAEGWLTAAALDAIDQQVLAVIEAAVAKAKAAAPPADSELETDVYISY
mgnify:CR=1 FL=1